MSAFYYPGLADLDVLAESYNRPVFQIRTEDLTSKEDVTKLMKEIAALKEALAACETERDQERDEKNALLAQLEALGDQNATVAGEANAHKTALASHLSAMEQKDQEHARALEELQKKHADSLEERDREHAKHKEDMGREHAKMLSEASSVHRKALEETRAKLSAHGKELDAKNKEVEEKNKEVGLKTKELAEKLKHINDLRNDLLNANKAVEEKDGELSRHRNELSRREKDVEEHKQHIDKLVAAHEDALGQHSATVEELQADLRTYEEEIDSLRTRIDELENELIDAHRLTTALKTELREASQELEHNRAWKDVRPTLGIILKEKHQMGEPVLVEDVQRTGPADAGGVRPGDAVLKINTIDIRHHADVRFVINSVRPGDVVKVAVRRNGEVLMLPVRMGPLPAKEVDDILESAGLPRTRTGPSQAEMMAAYHIKEAKKWRHAAEQESQQYRKSIPRQSKKGRRRQLIDRSESRSPRTASPTPPPASRAPTASPVRRSPNVVAPAASPVRRSTALS